jgi:putative ABC transport system permease protein
MGMLIQDLRFGLRMMAKNPGFTAVAIVTLALGIGAATSIFSVIFNVLLDPFPYKDAERFVFIQIHDVNESGPYGRVFFSLPEFLDIQEQNHVFDEVIGVGYEDVRCATGEGTEHFDGASLTPNSCRVLGVPALLGRGITPDDIRSGEPPVFVMSYKLWRRRYNLDPTVLGRTFVLNDKPRTQVGIMPPRFTLLAADLWVPETLDRSDPEAKQRYLMLHARLKPGVTSTQAQADIDVIARRLAQVSPKEYPTKFTVQIVNWLDFLVGSFRKTLYTLGGAVALLLLIACSNVANILMARGTSRQTEMAIRASLGASRWTLLRQLLIESLLLALCGAAAGCLIAYWGIRTLVTLIPQGVIPSEAEISLNMPVLLFSLGAAGLTALLFGLAPALQTAKRELIEPLKGSGKGFSRGSGYGKFRNALAVVEIALSLVLLAGAGLLMRSFVRLQQVDLGLNPRNVLVAYPSFPPKQYKTAAAKHRFFSQLLQRVHTLPGVVAATEAFSLPPFGGYQSDVDIAGKTHVEKWQADLQFCSEEYFRTLEIRLLRGRGLSEAEVSDARKVAVVNQTLAKRYFGNDDPIGRQIKLVTLETDLDPPIKNPVFEIVGVVADSKNRGIQEQPWPGVYLPYTVAGALDGSILVRTSKDPLAMVNTVQREVWAVDRNVALSYTGSLEGNLRDYVYAEPRFSLILLGVFAAVGLVLVTIGVYSVIAYTVSQQTHDIGIRMALGASHDAVLWMVLSMGARLIAAGVVIGLLASFSATRLIASQLWGVSPSDPTTLFNVVAVVVLAGFAACYFPARRATRVDPMVALRYE